MNLASGKVLYEDLRNRLKEATAIASKLDIFNIINNYGKNNEQDYDEEEYVVEMVAQVDSIGKYFETTELYGEIVKNYLAGKHVVFHFPEDELSYHTDEMMVPMIGYFAEYDTGDVEMDPSPIEIFKTAAMGNVLIVSEKLVVEISNTSSDIPGELQV